MSVHHVSQARPIAREDTPVLTVIEPDSLAPVSRLGDWLEEAGARLRTVRLWAGDPVPEVDALGDAALLMGGVMSAHSDADHPWLPGVRRLLRDAVDRGLPVLGICLGAQVAAEALGGTTAVPSPDGRETGIVTLILTEPADGDPLLGPAARAGADAAREAGLPEVSSRHLPVIVSHDDAVTALPQDAELLASTAQIPVHAWRFGSLLALQHHPEADPSRVAYWRARGDARELGILDDAAIAERIARGTLPEEIRPAAEEARARAEAIEPVTIAFGRALAAALVAAARERGRARA